MASADTSKVIAYYQEQILTLVISLKDFEAQLEDTKAKLREAEALLQESKARRASYHDPQYEILEGDIV